jgi:hypothetical protein
LIPATVASGRGVLAHKLEEPKMAKIARMNEMHEILAKHLTVAVAFKHTESGASSRLACLECGDFYLKNRDWDLEAYEVKAAQVLGGIWSGDDQCVHCDEDLLVLAHKVVGLNTQPHDCWSGQGECRPYAVAFTQLSSGDSIYACTDCGKAAIQKANPDREASTGVAITYVTADAVLGGLLEDASCYKCGKDLDAQI